MSMYPWHGTTGASNHHHHTAATASGPRIDHTTGSSSASSFQMPQLRWVPHALSRSQHQQQQQQQQQQQHQHQQNTLQQNTLPTISSSLRMGQNAHHQPVAVVVDARAGQAELSEASDSDQSDGAVRDAVGPDAMGDPDYAPSPDLGQGGVQHGVSGTVGARAGVGAGTGAGAGAGVSAGAAVGAGSGLVVGRLLGEDDLDGEAAGDTPRKHGKRLTTKEEVSLFDICNRHAADFGQRSNLCKWWKTVTEEFTRDQGHPYSWHSVRRKVEVVTKQRMKFLEEQREKGGSDSDDLSNPRWRTAVDAWIPTWQRWEEAEARRIEKRDSRQTRKRKDRSFDLWDGPSDGWRPSPSTPVVENRFQSQSQQPQASAAAGGSPPLPTTTTTNAGGAATTSTNTTTTTTSASSQNPVRLPPGFDSMFATQTPQTSRISAGTAGWTYPQAPTTSHAPSALESSMMTAVLETLGKLNRHLDSVTTDPRSSSLVTSLATTAGPGSTQDSLLRADENGISPGGAAGPMSSVFISQLKDELRQEMQDELRRELEKDRASLEEKLDSVQRTQEMILDMLRQEP